MIFNHHTAADYIFNLLGTSSISDPLPNPDRLPEFIVDKVSNISIRNPDLVTWEYMVKCYFVGSVQP